MLTNKIKIIYIYLMVTLFPVAFHDFYFDIADTKFVVFVALTLGMTAGMFVCTFVGKNVVSAMHELKGEIIKSSSVKWMIVWCIINIFSFAISKYKDIALYGTGGRDYGVITVICITVMFVAVAFAHFSVKKVTDVFVITSVVVALLAIFNSYGIDFIGFYDGVRKDLCMLYQSTFGHVDICSTFFSMALPVAVAKSVCVADTKIKKILYVIASMIIYAGMFGGGCDSAYIALAVMTVIMVIYIRDYHKMIYFIALMNVYMWIGCLMIKLNSIVPTARTMDSISLIVSDVKIVIAFTLFSVVFCFIVYKSKKTMKSVIYTAVVFSVILFLSAFIYFTFIDRKCDIGSLENILRFGDEWGSRRGYVWKVTVEKFSSNYWYNKIFGTGPDTLEPVLTAVYGEEMLRRFSAYYDNAHNEYLQYLITTGIAGFVAYIGLLVSVFKSGIRKLKTDENIFCIVIAVSCYLSQAFININQVITTPLMFLFMAFIVCDDK